MSLSRAVAVVVVVFAAIASPGGIAPSGAQAPRADDHFGAWFQTVSLREPGGKALYVGDLDGPAHHVLSADFIQGTGPREGRVLIWWQDGTDWRVELVGARSGARTVLMRTKRPIAAASFGLDDDWYYIVANDRGTAVRGLYRRRLAGGRSERIADGWAGSGTSMSPATDGATVAISSYDPDDASRSYRILDVRRRQLSVVPGRTYDDVVGMLGDELVAWEDTPMDALQLPLRAIARDGTSRRIADQDGWAAAIYPEADGSARLVYEGHDESGNHTLSVLAPGQSTGRAIYTGGPDWFEPPVQVVWRTQWMGIEVPGYVPVFPRAQVFLGEEDLESHGQLPRVLVPLDGGDPIPLAPQPVVRTPTMSGAMPPPCPEVPATLTRQPAGVAWLGTFVRTYGPESEEDAQDVWEIDDVVLGDLEPVEGSANFLQAECDPPLFETGGRYLVSTADGTRLSTHDTVAWRILPDGSARLVAFLPPSAYDPAYLKVSTFDDAVEIVSKRRGGGSTAPCWTGEDALTAVGGQTPTGCARDE